MNHDPMCPVKDKPCHGADNGDCPDEYGHFPSCPQAYCCCDLIARVRADEREGERIIYGYNNGYEQGVKDERERTPTIRLVLSEPDQEPLADQSFVRYSQQEARRTIAAINGSHP